MSLIPDDDKFDVLRYGVAKHVKETYKAMQENGYAKSLFGYPVILSDDVEEGEIIMALHKFGSPTHLTASDGIQYSLGTITIDFPDYPDYPDYQDLEIKDVIFNPPATIVLWKNGDKTVVKTMEGDEYNQELGLLHAIIEHKFFKGNKLEKHRFMKKMLDIPEELRELPCPHCGGTNSFDKDFLGVRECDGCYKNFSVNKVGRTKKV